MIISHKHKFIFVKTEKTAGTSVEIALSKYCGPDDVITPITPKDEARRRELGYPGPQNWRVPWGRHSGREQLAAVLRGRRLRYFNHASAKYIRKHIRGSQWRDYYTFCFERNPWDKAISWYYWIHRHEPRPSLSEFIQSGGANAVRGFELYTDHAEIIVDQVFRFEELDSAMETLRERIGLPETPTLVRAKGGHRKDTRSYREILTPADRDKIAKVFAREIAYFGYEW